MGNTIVKKTNNNNYITIDEFAAQCKEVAAEIIATGERAIDITIDLEKPITSMMHIHAKFLAFYISIARVYMDPIKFYSYVRYPRFGMIAEEVARIADERLMIYMGEYAATIALMNHALIRHYLMTDDELRAFIAFGMLPCRNLKVL